MCWVFIAVHGLSLVVMSGGYSLVSLHGLSSVVKLGLSCSMGCGIFLDQGLNPCLLHCVIYSCGSESRSVMSDSLRPHGLYSPWSSPGQNTGVGSLSLLQGIFLTQELNLALLHCRQILYPLSYQGRPLFSFNIYYLFGFPES